VVAVVVVVDVPVDVVVVDVLVVVVVDVALVVCAGHPVVPAEVGAIPNGPIVMNGLKGVPAIVTVTVCRLPLHA